MFVFVFVFIAFSFLVTSAAVAVMAREVLAKAKTAKGITREEVPVIILEGEVTLALFVQEVDRPKATPLLIMGTVLAPFLRGKNRSVVVLALAAKLVARRQGWQYYIAMPTAVERHDYYQVKRSLPHVTPQLVWEGLLTHELYHAKCFLERGMTNHRSVYDLYLEEIAAHKAQYSFLGHNLEDEDIDTAICVNAQKSVEMSGARAYLPEYA